MKLVELLDAVKEKNLTKSQLEEYRDDLVSLFAMMQLELADIRKQKAIYFVENKLESDKATERAWQASKKGLREIELSHYSKGVEKVLSSLKSRIYAIY